MENPKNTNQAVHYQKLPIESPFTSAPIYYTANTSSTMDDARLYLESGLLEPENVIETHGAIFWAGFQQNGRGRMPGRTWQSAPGANLLFTICLRIHPQSPFVQRISLLAALSLCRTMEEVYMTPAIIKWPNDVMASNRKIAGILGETYRNTKGENWIILGIGINLTSDAYPPELSDRAGSVAEAMGSSKSPDEVSFLLNLLSRLKESLSDLQWRSAINFRLHGKSKLVAISDPRHPEFPQMSATILEVAPDCRLKVKLTNGEEKLLSSGEVSFNFPV